MDHVINTLKNWLDIYEDNTNNRDEKAIRCIKAAIDELYKYYPSRPNPYEGLHDITKED